MILGFRYLRFKRILALFIVLSLSSMLFFTTALSLMGFYRGFTYYLGEEKGVIVIYDIKSRTPFTGLVPANLGDNLNITRSPEVIVPCILRNESVFLRGVIPQNFLRIDRIKMEEGEILGNDDLNSAIVGKNLAERLHIRTGDKLLVLGVLADRYVELDVKGIFSSSSPMDDEIIAPLHVGQWLRGTDYSYVTLIRIKGEVNQSKILEELGIKPSEGKEKEEKGLSPSVPSSLPLKAGEIGAKEAYDLMRSYMERYGLTRESLLVLSSTVLLLSSISIAVAFRTVVAQHRDEIEVIRSVGASRRLLKADILVKLLPWAVAASLTGLLLAVLTLNLIQRAGFLQVLSHSPPISVDPLIFLLNFLFVLLLMLASLRGDIN